MHVAITVDPEIPVPPELYGGIERIVDMVVRGLVERGHSVTLFGHSESKVPCRLLPYPGHKSQSKKDTLQNMLHVSLEVIRGKYDIVHSFGRLAYLLPILPLQVPKIMSYQRGVTPRSVIWGTRLSRGTLHFTGCSNYVVRQGNHHGQWTTVYNGVPRDKYDFQPFVKPDAPLVYLGRIEDYKGTHLAIEVAKRSNCPLFIAGNVPKRVNTQNYFKKKIEPELDGKQIRYIGPVNDEEKNKLLGEATAFLMPILWDEPFGIVMVEALACGTPVIGLNRGSVPEIVENGINGFVCESVEQMVDAVGKLGHINRQDCRRVMEEKFSDQVIVEKYERLYKQVTGKLS